MTEFEKFFDTQWRQALDNVPDVKGLFSDGGGLAGASWDRKAAYLFWTAVRQPEGSSIVESDELDDLLG